MCVLAIYDVKGDPDDLLERYDAALPRIVQTAPGKPLSHVCARTDQGIQIFDVWESRELMQDFAGNPKFRQAIAEAGLPEPDVHVLPVHRLNW